MAQVVQALVARAVKADPAALAVQQVPAVLLVLLAAQATTASVSPGLVMESRVIVLRVMASASRGPVMENPAIDQLVRHAMANANRGRVTVSLGIVLRAMANANRGPVTESRAIVLRVMVSASPGREMRSLGTVQRAPRVMVSVSHGLAMASQVTDHPGLEEIAPSGTPVRRVRAATALSAITKPTR